MTKLVMVIAAISATTGTLIMRYGGKNIDLSLGIWQALRDGYLWIGGIFLSWIAGLLWALYITRNDVSTAISFYVPLTYIFTFLGGILILKEPISLNKGLGCAFILIGLFFMFRSP